MKRPMRAMLVGAVLLLPGSMLLARAGWVAAKGALGRVLIDRALVATLTDGVPRAPWRWADMHPVARLRVPRLGVARPVLSNASGSAMAFGIGHVDGTAAPGSDGTCVLAGHRDSWAEFVFELRPGDEVALDTPEGVSGYRVVATAIVRHDDGRELHEPGGDRLTLLTCWPRRGWLHSPWRYVVRCERLAPATSTSG